MRNCNKRVLPQTFAHASVSANFLHGLKRRFAMRLGIKICNALSVGYFNFLSFEKFLYIILRRNGAAK